ncbi:protein ALP1-like [Silene latifolia]|uniref:protein ALP1-like n=1 Tax=Silene latifolia TaxID=37657 RepID=UPI003D76B27A
MAATPKRNTPTKRRTPTAATKKRKTPSLSTTITTTTTPTDHHTHPHRINYRVTTLPPLISDVTTAISAANTFLQTHDTLLLPSLTLSLHSSLSSTSAALSHLRSLLSLPSPSPPPLPPLPPPQVSLSSPSSPWFERFVLSSITDSDPRWAQTFRMSKPTFSLLSSTLSHSLSSALPDIPPHFALGCALYRLAHSASFSFIGRRFGFSSKDACRAFYTVCKVICADLGGYFGNFINDILMLNCCGVLGFEKFGIEENGEVLGEDGFLIVQALVDSDGRFLDVSTGWPSIFSPVSVLRQSRLYSAVEESKELLNGPEVELFDGHSVPQYILGESWYRSLPWVVTPFVGTGEGLSSSEMKFNEVHRRGMGFVKVAFGRVRANWQLLNRRWKDEFVEFLPFIITTACLLNNFLLKHGEMLPDVDVGSVEEVEEMSVSDGEASESAAKIRDLLALHLNQSTSTLKDVMRSINKQ